MADRPIPFTTPMVRALLAGTKTQTRRVIASARVFATSEQPAFTLRDGDLTRAMQGASRFHRVDGNSWSWEADAFEWQAPNTRTRWMAHIGFAPGDQLWVREAWRVSRALDDVRPRDLDRATIPEWLATDPPLYEGRRRAGRFLPRWASRLTLTVTSVRVERLQDISAADAEAEGVKTWVAGLAADPKVSTADVEAMIARTGEGSLVAGYAALWDAINGAGAWATNPWVAAYSFTVAHRNIDQGAQS